MNFEHKLDEALFGEMMVDAQIAQAIQAYHLDPSDRNLFGWYEAMLRGGRDVVIDTLHTMEYTPEISENFHLGGTLDVVDPTPRRHRFHEPEDRFGEMMLSNESVVMDKHPYNEKLLDNFGTIRIDFNYHWNYPIRIDPIAFGRLMQYKIQREGMIQMSFEHRAMHSTEEAYNEFIAGVYGEEFVWATFDWAVTEVNPGDPIIVEYTTVLHDDGWQSALPQDSPTLPSGGRVDSDETEISHTPTPPEPPGGP